jgi:hypothetical protein
MLEVLASPRVRDRFSRKVDASGACHLWLGSTNSTGYGLLQGSVAYQGFSFLAHRVAWALANSQDPGLSVVRHACDNPLCCNPDHLSIGSQTDNMRDAAERGRLNPSIKRGAEANAADFSQADRDRAHDMRYVDRRSIRDIAAAIGCHPATVSRWLSEAEPRRACGL